VTERIPMIIDVDTGIDDAIALLYAVGSPDDELVGVTCVGGNVEARQVAINTRAVLELAGRDDVEVALGAEQPLTRPLRISPDTHGPEGIGYAQLPPPRRPLSRRSGPELIVEEIRRRPGEITLVTTGPLTNLALALQIEPDLPRLVRAYVLMGGAYRVSGNTTPTTEWNIHVDPEAARAVFAAWAAAGAGPGEAGAAAGVLRPLALGLDVTETVPILPEHMVRLARRAGSRPDASITLDRGENPMRATGSVASNPVIRFVADALRFYMEFHAQHDGFYGAYVHDAVAVAAALDQSLVRSEAVFVDVETSGELTAGQTVADWRRLTGRPANLDIVVEADTSGFFDRLIERVGGLAANRPVDAAVADERRVS
jgi:purine nucleosidase